MKAALAINKKEYKIAVKHLIGGKFYNRAHNVSWPITARAAPLWKMRRRSSVWTNQHWDVFFENKIQIIFDHLVSRWIIDGRTDELREMLQELDQEEKIRKIEDWEAKGSVLVDYFEIKFMIENIQQKAEVSHIQLVISMILRWIINYDLLFFL